MSIKKNLQLRRKISYALGTIISVVSVGTLIVVATSSSNGIPDDVAGTLGNAFVKIIGPDWETNTGVQKTNQLAGMNGDSYVVSTTHLIDCRSDSSGLKKFLTKIEKNGTYACNVTQSTTARIKPILATIRDIDSNCSTQVKINSNPVNSAGPLDIQEGDTITTGTCSLSSLYFVDHSIVRLAANTTITLRSAGSSTGTGASDLTLTSGELWARVLKPITDDSYFNVSTQEGSVGVRGTSVYIKRSSSMGLMAIPVDSGKLDDNQIASKSPAIIVTARGSNQFQQKSVPLGYRVTVNPSGNISTNLTDLTATGTIYNNYAFTRSGTLADIADFRALKDGVGPLATISATARSTNLGLPSTDTYSSADLQADDTLTNNKLTLDLANVTNPLTREFLRSLPLDNTEQSALCGNSSKWWDAVPLGRENCIESNVSFLADYSKNDSNLYGLGLPNAIARIGSPSIDNGGIKIQSIGDYIQYTPPDLNLMKGAKVKITFQTDVQTLAAASPNRYIFDGGTGNWKFILKPDKTVTINRPPGDSGGSGNCYANVCEFQFGNVVAPNQLIFGALFNNISAKYVNPIGTTIQSISISPPASVGP